MIVSLPELLVATALLTLMAGLGFGQHANQLTRLQVEVAARRLAAGLERGRDAAERMGEPCALELGPWGWRGAAAMGAVACDGADTSLDEGLSHGELVLAHTFPAAVRFAVHGLAIDGGTAVVGAPGTDLVRCLVMSQPLGVVRVGRYRGAITASPKASDCLPDPAL
jgi:hypothetical protein